jgi:hypothetical protein
VVDVAEPAGLRNAGDKSVLADKGLRGDQPLADAPAPRAFPQMLPKETPGLRRAEPRETGDLRGAPRTADIGAHRGDNGAEWIRCVARVRTGEGLIDQEEEFADKLIEPKVEVAVPAPQDREEPREPG